MDDKLADADVESDAAQPPAWFRVLWNQWT